MWREKKNEKGTALFSLVCWFTFPPAEKEFSPRIRASGISSQSEMKSGAMSSYTQNYIDRLTSYNQN